MGGPGLNTTDPDAASVHGTNPQNLVEKILRMRIYDHAYWKEHCFALSAETLVDKAVDIQYVGGTYGGNRSPTPFICLILKMLQIQPDKEIIVELIKNEEYKYVRALGAFYMRLVGKPVDIYQYLEPLYNDYRKIRYRSHEGFQITHMDEFVDKCLSDETFCDIALPSFPKRNVLEDNNFLAPRISVLDDEFTETNEPDTSVTEQVEPASSAVNVPQRKAFDSVVAAPHHKSAESGHVDHHERSSKHRHRSKDRDQRSHKRRRRSPDPEKARAAISGAHSAQSDATVIQEANVLRASLGLKPLR
jgi:pre-mRNA-splicing factor 38A